MKKIISILLLFALLSGCVTVPGSNVEPPKRYVLLSDTSGQCLKPMGKMLSLTLSERGPGLNTDRIAYINSTSAELSFLPNVRWANDIENVVENRLSQDLECSGVTVLTGAERRREHGKLVCELRAFHIVETTQDRQADVSVSCTYLIKGSTTALLARKNEAVGEWTVANAIRSLERAYIQVATEIIGAVH